MKGKQKKIVLIILSFIFTFSASIALADNKINRLDDIVITGTKTQHTLQDVPVETIVITREDIQKKNSQNIMDLLKDVPGIQTSYHNDVFGTYTWLAKMRGLDFNSGYALILIDGQRAMGCGQSGGMGEYGVGINQIPVEMIERIEIVKGPGSALYGSDAMAGVVNIITKRAPQKATGSAGVAYGQYDVKRENSDGSEEDANGSRKMSKTYVSYGDRITDNVGYFIHYNYESADDIAEDPVKSWKHSFLGKLDAKINEKTDIFLKTEFSDYEKEDNREEDSYRLSGIIDWHLSQNHSLSLKGYTYNWDFTHGYPGYSYGYKYGDVGYHQAELQYTWDINNWNTLVLGGETQLQGIDYTIENDDGSVVSVNEDVKTSSLYIQDEAVLLDKLTLVGSARYDHHSTFGKEVNPKFSLMYQPQETTTIRACFGTSFKSPTIRQLYYNTPYRHGSFYAQSNPELKPETAVGYGVSIEQWFMSQKMMVDLGYFRNEIEDMVISEDTGTLYNGLTLMRYKNVEKAWTQGIEFMCRAYLTDELTASFSYTYTDTENEESGKELTYVSRHSASFSPAYDWDKYGIGVSASIAYNSKQYTNTDNTQQIDAGAVFDAKIYKQLSKTAKLSFEADDIFDSVPARDGSFHAGRTFTAKLDIEF
ncbi:TonB-dependent receptor plug domain-containing protein [Desulfobacula toluolica]|uniref:TonB-dependent receptor n=1 Tax=Desulfobacula toluolica (strain DSM 7467 / Tol2) TaxID=651182 RepID=K0NGZ0_DESTT|nr:TonB-dependent receptor [Desulfobacula toluolica]CCK79113.1 TonB-dependent receptor [Desulfobacula toluolica Tol2]